MQKAKGLLSAAVLLTTLSAGPADAQYVPYGSYLNSCENIEVDFGRLLAVCRTDSGRRVETSMMLRSCPQGADIANENGRLVCNGVGRSAGYNPYSRPHGSYRDSCRDVRVSGGWMTASCQDTRGRWRDATIALDWCKGRDITNDNGRLSCG
ncbi:CVNH domain-containing protein [Oryzicola mucosus]|uniref:CVNH domain-containing protein n=1 Tax=Oryzicola mucosus TaxID=2767425 RepID=A0A8J6PEE1_9HYPH|nr:CVNH domain-containing protein [Oryzicola mucosus]MBD0413239.1 CVNH domain-containing protein [Oryzicola mucosus]